MTDTNFDPAHREMGRHIASGIFNSGLSQVVLVLCQIGSVIVVSRLLPPEDFGILAMASPVYGFICLFHDFGLSQATVQKPSLGHDEINAFFWINIAVGLILAAATIAVSPLVGWYYHDPRVTPLVIAMGLLILVGATGNQHSAILTRRMEFGALALNGAVGAVAGLAGTIIAALIIKNYWALYVGLVTGTVVPVIGIWMLSRWRPTAPKWVPGLGHTLKFGAHITGASIAGFFSGNMDNVLIGHRWGDQPLGLYDRAYKLLLFPLQRVVGPVMGTMVPVLSRVLHEPERYRAIFLKTVGQLTLVMWPGILWSIILGDALVPVLLGKNWANAAGIFAPLAMAGLAMIINWPTTALFVSQGRGGEYARWSIFSAVKNIIAFLIGLPYGPSGVAAAYAICAWAFTPVLWWYVGRSGPVSSRDVYRAIWPQMCAAAAAAMLLVVYRAHVETAPLLYLAGGLVLSYTAAGSIMCLSAQGRETLKQSLQAAHKIWRHVRTIKLPGIGA